MSSLLLRCLRREPSAGEIVPQIKSEARLQWRGLRLRNRSNTNRGQSSRPERALPPTQEDTLAEDDKTERQTDITFTLKVDFRIIGISSNKAMCQEQYLEDK